MCKIVNDFCFDLKPCVGGADANIIQAGDAALCNIAEKTPTQGV